MKFPRQKNEFTIHKRIILHVNIIFTVTITLVSSSKHLQSLFCRCDYEEGNLKQMLGF